MGIECSGNFALAVLGIHVLDQVRDPTMPRTASSKSRTIKFHGKPWWCR